MAAGVGSHELHVGHLKQASSIASRGRFRNNSVDWPWINMKSKLRSVGTFWKIIIE